MAEALWRQTGPLWCLDPPAARRGGQAAGRIEFIGGSYLAATPQLSYRRLLEALALRGWAVRAWSYVPGFDHQAQANEAWRAFRGEREEEARRSGAIELPLRQPLLRLGHSLGCKLHLLAPDGGRRCDALLALSFNNFTAERSVPLLVDRGDQLRRAFGVPSVLGLLPGRVTYVIDPEGVIRHVFNNLLDGPAHRREAIEALQRLQAG